MKKYKIPFTNKELESLRAGDEITVNGTMYTARDQAHKRLAQAIEKGRKLPVNLKGQSIYYCGPTPAPKGKAIGSCGPTTSSRMDSFTPALLKAGVKAMIGKGARSQAVVGAIKKYEAVYFVTYAGCGALLCEHVKSARAAAYADLGPEAVFRLEVEDFPLIVAIDTKGRNILKGRR